MDMICTDCQGKEFVFDYEAVEKIGHMGNRLLVQISDPASEGLKCAHCFRGNIMDKRSGLMVNDTKELLDKLRTLPGASLRLDLAATKLPINIDGISIKKEVFWGHISQADFLGGHEVRERAMQLLAELADGNPTPIEEAIEDNLIELYHIGQSNGAGITALLELTLLVERDEDFEARPKTIPSYVTEETQLVANPDPNRFFSEKCPCCGVGLGAEHLAGCEMETCSLCGFPSNGYISQCTCRCSEFQRAAAAPLPWAGEDPATTACKENNLWAIYATGFGMVSLTGDHPKAEPDKHRLYKIGQWDAAQKKWVVEPPKNKD